MNKLTQKILLAFIFIFSIFATTSCDFFKQNTTASTTAVETTVVTTTAQETTVTTYPSTTVPPTTITTEPITTTTETTTIATTTFVDHSRIVIEVPDKTVYTVGEEFSDTGMVVTYYDASNNPTILSDMDYTLSSVNMNTYGEKQITVTYGDYQAMFTIQVNLPSYYTSAMDLTGDALFLQLRTIIHTGFQGVTYGDARYILDETDADPNHPGNLILVYLGTSVSGYWDGGITWNREHLWPQSGMPVSADNGTVNMASDLQNLKPSDPGENSSRGNKFFSLVSSAYSYVPRVDVRGDIARSLLYMIVMYDELTLTDSAPNLSNYEMGLFYILLAWNQQDPVDDFERNRNEVIYSYQHNRNPFIDYPGFADLIW